MYIMLLVLDKRIRPEDKIESYDILISGLQRKL